VGALALVLLGHAVMGGALWLPRGGGEREASSPARAAVPERTAPGPRSDAAGAAPPTGARLAAPPTPGRSSPSEATAAGAARPSDEPPTAMDVAVGSTEGRAASDVSGRSAEARSAEARDAATPRRDPAPASRNSAATEPTRPSAPTARRSAPEPAPPAATADPEPAVRNIMPELTVAGTVWHPDPGQRTARVELAGRGEPLVLRDPAGGDPAREVPDRPQVLHDQQVLLGEVAQQPRGPGPGQGRQPPPEQLQGASLEGQARRVHGDLRGRGHVGGGVLDHHRPLGHRHPPDVVHQAPGEPHRGTDRAQLRRQLAQARGQGLGGQRWSRKR